MARGAVLRVNPVTGSCGLLSLSIVDATRDIAVEASGTLVIAKGSRIIRIDPENREETIVSDATHGSGPTLVTHDTIAVEANGNLVLGDSLSGNLLHVNPATGDRNVINDMLTPDGIAVEPDGNLVVVDSTHQAVVRVNPSIGTSTIVSQAPPFGQGPGFSGVEAIAVEGSGALIIWS